MRRLIRPSIQCSRAGLTRARAKRDSTGDQLSRCTAIGLVRRTTTLCVAPFRPQKELQRGTTAREPAFEDGPDRVIRRRFRIALAANSEPRRRRDDRLPNKHRFRRCGRPRPRTRLARWAGAGRGHSVSGWWRSRQRRRSSCRLRWLRNLRLRTSAPSRAVCRSR